MKSDNRFSYEPYQDALQDTARIFAPKALNKIAQGNALGSGLQPFISPERA
jgi:hypothetical protein